MQQTKKKNIISLIEIAILFIIWVIIYISPVIFHSSMDQINWHVILNNWRRLFPFFVLSLMNHFVLVPLLFFKNRKLLYIVSALLVIVSFSIFLKRINPLRLPKARIETRQRIYPPRPERMQPDPPLPPLQNTPGGFPPLLNSAFLALMIIGFDTGLRTVFKLTKSEQERDKIEKEMIKSELAFLRNQVSPHFFMNTLNNIHALIDFDTEKAKETVIQLSKLMRYLLYDSEIEKIPLKKEMAFIRNYVELMKMRIAEEVEIIFFDDISDPEKKIPPLIFTSLIENAFKYGISYQNDSFIKIEFSTTNQELFFVLTNSIGGKPKDFDSNYSGIGLDNTKKRLNILYGNNYSMDIQSDEKIFTVTLKLPL
jgi:hypothetical protein